MLHRTSPLILLACMALLFAFTSLANAQTKPIEVALTPTPKQVNKTSGKVSDKGAMAVLIFDSVPSGADVYINDEYKGTTPYQGISHKVGDALNIEVKEPTCIFCRT